MAITRAGKPLPFCGFGNVTMTRAPASGTWFEVGRVVFRINRVHSLEPTMEVRWRIDGVGGMFLNPSYCSFSVKVTVRTQ